MQTETKADKGKEQEGRSPASRISGSAKGPLSEKILTTVAVAGLAAGLVLGNAKCASDSIGMTEDAWQDTDAGEIEGLDADVVESDVVPDEGTDVEETADVLDEGIEPDVVPDEGTDVEETADVPEVESDAVPDEGIEPDVVPDEGTDVEETADVPEVESDAVPDEGIEPDVVPDEGTDVEETADVPEVESDVTADEAEPGETGVVCEGVHDEVIRTYTLRIGVPTEMGEYNVTATGNNPTGTGVLVDVGCVSGGTVASGEDFVFHEERTIDRTNPEERERLRINMLARIGDFVLCMASVEFI